MKKIVLGLSLALVLSLAVSCIIAVVDTSESGMDGTAYSYRKSAPFSAGGKVSLVNTNGDILVRGWDDAHVEVLAREPGNWPRPRGFRILRDRLPGARDSVRPQR